jgi:hypothetical protein
MDPSERIRSLEVYLPLVNDADVQPDEVIATPVLHGSETIWLVEDQDEGRQLAERLLNVRPGLKVLFMSGYTENAIVHHGILDAGIEYVQKPLVPDTLARRVREVLDAPARPLAPRA